MYPMWAFLYRNENRTRMDALSRKQHWEAVYQHKVLEQASWYQATPDTALFFLQFYQLPGTARIIDIGGGDSLLADHLLDLGYGHVSVLDISEKALERAQKRLGQRAGRVTWIAQDVVDFQPAEPYDFWHDRAAFHFLKEAEDIRHYVEAAAFGVRKGGILLVGAFSTDGPNRCSGLDVVQYDEEHLVACFQPYFQPLQCVRKDHLTPSGTVQNFVFCCLTRV